MTDTPSMDGLDDLDDLDDTPAPTDDLDDLLDATTTDFTPIRLPKAIHASLRARVAEEKRYPADDGTTVSISTGELIAFVWRLFLEQYPEPDGTVATWVHQLHQMRAKLREEQRAREARTERE
jgi:hypothetical protein